MIYFLSNGRAGPIKIGYAGDDVGGRVADLQTGNPERLLLIYSCSGDRKREKAFHSVFEPHRLRGEWFRRKPVLNWILSVTNPDEYFAGDIEVLPEWEAPASDPMTDHLTKRVESVLLGAGATGIRRSELAPALGSNNFSRARIAGSLTALEGQGLAWSSMEDTPGRRAERWFHTEAA